MDTADVAVTGDVFENVFFAIIIGEDIDRDKADELISMLTDNGAIHLPRDPHDLEGLTHLIADNADFEGYDDAIEGLIHVVKPSWVEVSIRKGKPANPRQYSPDPLFFFANVVVCCADDIPKGDQDAIIGGVYAMGGQYTMTMTRLVTHLVTLSEGSPQYRILRDKNLKCKAVLPHWFDACLRLGKKIEDAPFVVPRPRLQANVRARSSAEASEAQPLIEPDPFAAPLPTDSPSRERKRLAVFRNKKVMLHSDLALSQHLVDSISEVITKGGGEVVDDLIAANMLICHWRGSRDFVDALRANKDIGNLNWLYCLIRRNTWIPPIRRLLYFPIPRNGIEGFKGLRITLTNYQGNQRIFLENLVRASGAEFTKTMDQENTHLIAAYRSGEKFVAAKEWEVECVNHLWLEECYADCTVKAVTNPKYTTWPEDTDLGQIVGKGEIKVQTIRDLYELEEEDDATEGAESPIEKVHSRSASYKSIEHGPQTPRRLLFFDTPKETSTSRGAKNRALQKLHDMATDIALFQKETKRVGGVIYGGRRVSDPDRVVLKAEKKRGSPSESEDSEEEMIPESRYKKHKTFDGPPITVILTGVDKCDRASLRRFGLRFTDDPLAKLDVVVSPRYQRTRKFLCALASAPTIVSPAWLTDMMKRGERLPYEDYSLDEGENAGLQAALERAKVNHADGGLFGEMTIFCTENVKAGFDVYQSIVNANGGKLQLFKGRETEVKTRKRQSQPLSETVDANSMAEQDELGGVVLDSEDNPWSVPNETNKENGASEARKHPLLYCISDPQDQALWHKFEVLAKGQEFRPRLVTDNWLLEAARTQKLPKWKSKWDVTAPPVDVISDNEGVSV